MKLEITKEKVLKASETCPDAKAVLEELFPDAFEKKGDITMECSLKVTKSGSSLEEQSYFLEILHGDVFIACSDTKCTKDEDGKFTIPFFAIEGGYEFKVFPNGNFCILKKN